MPTTSMGLVQSGRAVQINSKGNVILGTGNPYNGVVIPGFSGFPSSADGRRSGRKSPICDGATCNSLFNSNLPKSYINSR